MTVLSGASLRLFDDLDRAFLTLASAWGAEEERHPALISAADLDRVDYLESFPQLATFAVALADEDANLDAFRTAPLDDAGAVRLTTTAPVREVLTPAACYHVYVHHAGEALAGPAFVTTRNTCFRREAEYVPLQRQWSFQMREVVCVGTAGEVEAFLARAQALVDAFIAAIDVEAKWATATDPFFRPASNPKYLLQRVQPTKHELVFDGHLAVASVNNHHDFFGSVFGISRDGRAASSGCLAFGLERWLFAVTTRHGDNPASWPDVVAAAEKVAA